MRANVFTVCNIVKNKHFDLKKTQLCSRGSYARRKVNTHFIVDMVQLENSPTDEVFVAIFIP